GGDELLDAVIDIDRAPKALERLVSTSRSCREASGVEVRHGIVRLLLDNDALLRHRALVVPSAVGGKCLRGLLPSGLVRFACGSPDHDDRRAVLLGRRLALRGRLNLDEGARRRLDGLTVDLEGRCTAEDDVELLLSGFSEHGLVVLADDVDPARRAK